MAYKYKEILEMDWFGNKTEKLDAYLNKYAGQPELNFLVIGAFNGKVPEHILKKFITDPSSKVTCIDSWIGSMDHNYAVIDKQLVGKAFDERLEPYKDRVIKVDSDSADWLMKNNFNQYDFIYIDGKNKPIEDMLDILLSYRMLKIKGMMCINNAGWVGNDDVARNAYADNKFTGFAGDWFTRMNIDKIKLNEKSDQIWFTKTKDDSELGK